MLGQTQEPDRFRILERLGEGATGVVYRAWDRRFGAEVALKTLRLAAPRAIERLKHEFRRACELSHPNLVAMHDLVVDGDTAFFTMELVRGTPIDARERTGPELEDLAIQLLSGLAEIHAAGLLHRDIKPSNVLVDADGRAVLLDFGLALLQDEAPQADVAGTLDFLAPEVLAGADQSEASDLFALGRMLDELVERLQQPVRPALAEVIAELLAPDPRARPTATGALARLGVARPRPVSERAHRVVGRHHELARLRSWLEPGAVVRVEGASGIGKTTLLQELQAHRPMVRCRCHPAEVVPFNAFDDLLQTLVLRLAGRSTPALDRALAPVAAVFPGVRAALPPQALEPPDPVLAEVAEGIRLVLHHLLGPDGALWIDDAQWLGEDSHRLLATYLALPGRGPVVLSHRPLAEPWLESARAMTLGPLSPEAAGELARELVGAEAPALVAAAGGNPLLLHRLARDHDPLERLEPLARRLMALVATQDGPMPIEVLARASGGGAALRAALASLTRHRLLAFASTREINVAHDALRPRVLDGMGAEDRAEAHRALAQAYLEHTPTDHASVARHLWEAGERAAVRDVALAAARDAEQVRAWSRAARYLRMAVEASPAAPAELRRTLARALAAAGRSEEAARELLEVAAPGDLRRAAELLVCCGAFDEGRAVLARVLAAHGLAMPGTPVAAVVRGLWWAVRARMAGLEPAQSDDPELVPVVDALWTVSAVLGQHDTARTFAFQGQHLATALRCGDPRRAARALAVEAMYAEGGGASASYVARLDARLDALTDRLDDATRAWLQCSRGYRDFMAGRILRALERFDRAEEVFRETGEVRFERTLGWTHRVYALVQLGDYRALRESTSALRQRFEEVGDRAGMAGLDQGAGYLLDLADDEPARAVARLDEALAMLPRPLPPAFAFLDLVARVHVDLYEGAPEEGFERLSRSWWSLGALQLFRMPRITLRWLWAVTGATSGRLSARRVRATARRLRGEACVYGDVFGALVEARAAGAAGDLVQRAEAASMGMIAAAARLSAGETEVVERLREDGIVAPEKLLRLFT